MVSVGEERRELVESGCPKLAQEIWPSFVRLEGQGASLLAFVGSSSCWLLVGHIQDWWWASPWYLIAYACSIHTGHLRLFWPHPWSMLIRLMLGYAALCASFDVVLVHSVDHSLYSLGCSLKNKYCSVYG